MERLKLQLISHFLESSKILCGLSYLCLILSSFFYMNNVQSSTQLFVLTGIIILNFYQTYLFIRIQFDQKIFKGLSEFNSDHNSPMFEQLDQTLYNLKLIKKPLTTRNLDHRFNGCKIILFMQIMTIILQYLGFILILIFNLHN